MKLGRFAILMLGIMVFVVAVAWGYFLFYMPNMKEVDLLKTNTEANNTEANKMTQAQNRVKKAKQMVDAKAAVWRAIVATRTPTTDIATGGIDLSVNPWQLSVDTPKFRDSIQRAVNVQVKKGGVKVITSPMVRMLDANLPVNQILSSFYNYPALKFPVVIFDFGTITVQGTYKQITDNVRAYKDMPHYLAVTDGLRIDGTSPNLTGTYNLTVVGFIRTPKKVAPPVNEGAAASSAGMGGGFPGAGGRPPGVPGGGGFGGPPPGVPGGPMGPGAGGKPRPGMGTMG